MATNSIGLKDECVFFFKLPRGFKTPSCYSDEIVKESDVLPHWLAEVPGFASIANF